MAQATLFRGARFVTSVREVHTLPAEGEGEIAFAGRSNAGKSSALNTLADQRRLAFVSKTPGRTQLINYFDIGNNRFLVDLPGYGYAKVPDAIRAPWGRDLGEYVRTRTSLKGLALIMDSRHPMSPLDEELLAWFRPTMKPVHVLLTKADKLSRDEASRTLITVRQALAGMAGHYSAQLFSSLKRTGIEEAEAVFAEWLGVTLKATPGPAQTAGNRQDGASRNKKAPGLRGLKPGDKMP